MLVFPQVNEEHMEEQGLDPKVNTELRAVLTY